MDKPTLRTHVRSLRAALRPLVRAQEEELVNAAVVSDEVWAAADVVAVYKAVGDELSVVSATNHALRTGKRVCFPRVAPGDQLVLHEVTDWAQLEPGQFGVPEPPESAPVVSPATVDVCLVPGVAFSERGDRLGQGKGYYDRLLPTLGGTSWGAAFSCQVVDAVPTEPHDRPVDVVVWPGNLELT